METHKNNIPLAITFFIALTKLQHTCLGQNSPQDYLAAHNAARAQVGVGPMSWDNTVAAFAQNYVNSRIDDCNLIHSGNSLYGENLATGSGDFMTGQAAVDLWVRERYNYNYASNTCASGQVCGHYTQVVWRNSVRLGCARARCNNGWWFVSCNYSPPGNFVGQRPYSPPVQSPSGSPVITTNGAPPIQNPAHPPQSVGSGGGSSSNQEPWKLVVLVLSVTGAGLLIIISIFCCIRRRRTRGSHNSESNLNVEQFLLQHGSLSLKRYKYSEIKKMTKSLSDKLGQGGYGSVYKGKLPDGSFVAVKVLTDTGSNGEDFINEVSSISRTSHVNIVNLLGFCFDSKHRALVYEYMPNKSLDKYIGGSSTGSDSLDIEILYMISVGVAKGLEYLHMGCNTRIVHFDIKPQNILLDEEFCPKISDFGLAKLCKKKQSLMSVMGTRGTVGYIAPEVFSRNFGGVSHKSDVYSYGMMVLEMAGANMTGVNQTHMTSQSSENYFPEKIYERVVDITSRLDGFGIEEEEETARKMLLVGLWCIQINPTERPSISKVLEMLEGSIESIQIPPKPVLFTPPTLPVLGELSSSISSYVDEIQPSAEGIIQS